MDRVLFFVFFCRCNATTSSGLASWDSVGTQIDIESELRNIATQCPNGEEVRNGKFPPHFPFGLLVEVKCASDAITAQFGSI